MSQRVVIENDAIRMEVWPQVGGKEVSSIIDKADSYELLFNYPSELPETPSYDVPYGNGWYAGWDECFPTVAPSKYVGHPYDGIPVPDHGEIWGIPVTTAVPTRNGITTVWHGLRFGYRLTRKLYLEGFLGRRRLHAGESGAVRLPLCLGSFHSLMSLAQPATLDIGEGSLFRWSHDADGNDIQLPFEMAPTADGVDLSNLAALPARKGWKVFSGDRIDAPVVIRYPTRNRTLQIEYASEDGLIAYWGIWINTGGWAGNRHFAIEPTTEADSTRLTALHQGFLRRRRRPPRPPRLDGSLLVAGITPPSGQLHHTHHTHQPAAYRSHRLE